MSPTSALGNHASTAPADRLVTLPRFPVGQIPTLGFIAIDWAERNLKQPNGPNAGKPFRYAPDQVNFLLWAYAIDKDARWLFNHLVRRLAKGSGKSPFAATYALIEFLAPVRLDRFDDRVLGGVIGRPVSLPWVQIAATAESQTKNTMRFVRAFCPKNGQLARDYDIDVGKTQCYRQPEGTLEVITSSFTAAEGAQTTAALGDETEHWGPSNQGPEFMSTIIDNLTKTGGRMMETANAWKPGADTVAEASWDDWVAQEEGRLKGDQRILYDARVAPADCDMGDRDSLRSALEHVYAFCPWVDVDNVIGRIWRKSAAADDSRRKYLNRPTESLDSWTEAGQFALLHDPDVVVEPGDDIVLFFDGSKSRDATALVACRIADGHVFVPKTADSKPAIWEPETAHNTTDTVDVIAVDLAVEHISATYNVLAFFADVQEWESFVKINWPKLFPDLVIDAQPTGKDQQPVAWDMRNHVYDFTRACELVLNEIGEKAFTHDGNAILSRHVANCRNRPNRYGTSVGKESKSSPNKIDAAVCMIGARMIRHLVLATPEWKKRDRLRNKKPGRVTILR